MYQYILSNEEREYLKSYSTSKYERPSLATDIVVLSVMEEGERENTRKRPDKALKILLIKRATHPFKGMWALPGGFCRPDEDVETTARRELYEETGINAAYLELAGAFGAIDRDPRGWIISNTFLSLINGADYRLRAESDAWEARWFAINIGERKVSQYKNDTQAQIVTEYHLVLHNEDTDTVLDAKVLEEKEFIDYHEKVSYKITECEGIGFDHAQIILFCVLMLRNRAGSDLKIPFDLLPELFTLSDLQSVFELVLNRKLTKANFRRKIAPYVVETTDKEGDGAHRPAALFRRNIEAFYRWDF
ncbi:MAG: NUDIX hydrolase [Lachnospiraceae bacterium]|nr:NUDIX hydrolase [Lachnospiraceae bacterium]